MIEEKVCVCVCVFLISCKGQRALWEQKQSHYSMNEEEEEESISTSEEVLKTVRFTYSVAGE